MGVTSDVKQYVEAAREKAAECGACILPNETMERRIDFMAAENDLPDANQLDKRFNFIVLVASIRYMAGNGTPTGWLETTRVAILQYRMKVKGRTDAGFTLSGFPRGEFAYHTEALVALPVRGDVTT